MFAKVGAGFFRSFFSPSAATNVAASETVSIVVPVLNEQPMLTELIDHLHSFSDVTCEIIIVDGGSDDGSFDIIKKSGFFNLQSGPGRALQMNQGAANAEGDWLVFLHADTRLPSNAVARVSELAGRYCWGRFDVILEGKLAGLKVVAWAMNLRSRLTGIATGDQAIFVKRKVFLDAGGFPAQPIMEDIELCKRLKLKGPPACLRDRVRTSGRRWQEQGLWRTIFLMWRLRFAYWRGVSAQAIAVSYPYRRSN